MKTLKCLSQKHPFIYRLSLFMGIVLMVSCSGENELFPEKQDAILPGPSSSGFDNLRDNALDDLTQNFTETPNDDGVVQITSEEEATVEINTACLTFGGEAMNDGDELEIEFVELYNRGNLLTTNIATMGRHDNGDASMLVTGGAFYLNVYLDGVPADPDHCGFKMVVPAANTGGPDEDMILWYGEFDENDNLVWEDANAEDQPGGELTTSIGESTEDAYYNVWGSKFGWTNVDRFFTDSRPQTPILASVPKGYNPDNASVYLSYDGELGLARLDYYDEDTKLFNEHYGLIPIGLEIHVVFVSESNGQWVYAIKSVTIEEDMVIEITMDDLDTATETELTNLIEDLP